jgi:hypothetical protein
MTERWYGAYYSYYFLYLFHDIMLCTLQLYYHRSSFIQLRRIALHRIGIVRPPRITITDRR